jgi:hypothetical protein
VLDVRKTVHGQGLSFTEIAKTVGERWQVLLPQHRKEYERQAKVAKDNFHAQLAEYKKTPQYDAYQKYLEEFRTKHPASFTGKQSVSFASVV